MNKEDLFDGFGNLDEDLLRRSEQGGRNMHKKRNKSKIVKIGSVAACLAVALGMGALFWNNSVTDKDKTPDNNDNVVAENSGNDTTIQGEVLVEEYINVSMLLASNEGIVDEALIYSNIIVGDYIATYFKVASVESDVLGKSRGEVVEGNQNWYRLSGHDDLFYLISYDHDEYSLWKFGNFEEDNYPYVDVLQLIFDIDSAEDIKQIVVNPATMDNTEEGQAIQNEIGTVTVADADSISTIYNVLAGLICYGDNNWDMINLGKDTPSSMLEQVRAGRYLTFITTDGIEIDTLK